MAETMATYNGYFNYETWNVCLWCDNEEPIYHEAQDIKESYGLFDDDSAEEFVKRWYPDGTPDMQTEPVSSYDDVDWQEVADNFNAE